MNAESQQRPEAAVSSSQSAGAVLRQYRQSRGVEPETLAASLHVPVSKIQALEDDRLEAMPDVIFARALAMSVCRYLKVDATPVLARMPQQDASRLAARDERGIDSPLSRPSFMPEGSVQTLQRLLNGRVAAVAVVVLGLLYLGIQSGHSPQPVAPPALTDAAPATPTPNAPGEPPPAAPETPAGATTATPPGMASTVVSPAAASAVAPTVTTPVTPAAASK